MSDPGTAGAVDVAAAPARAEPGRGRRMMVVGILVVASLAMPWLGTSYLLSAVTLALYLAYVGQAWNVMMGFAGQLSLGHSLYVGLGAYVSAGIFVHTGVGPWASVWLAVGACAATGAFIGLLAFRLRIAGVQLSLLTIAFAELARIGFDHIDALGGPGGLFVPVVDRGRVDLLGFRGPPALYYYAMLALAAGALGLCALLLRSRAGYYWRAIREDEAAAEAVGIDTFRWKMFAVVLSSAMTAVAGTFFAFYNGSLFPEQIFGFERSVEILVGPVVGGLGTLFGPIVGAATVVLLGDGTTELLSRAGIDLPGVRQGIHGLLLLLVTIYMPNGIWPPLARALGFEPRRL
jgi:branched-chain amino acid transport system permease protein